MEACSDSILRSAPVKVAAFYKFVAIADPAAVQNGLRSFCAKRGIKGTILIAAEGINATVCGSDEDIAALVDALRADPRFSDLEIKLSYSVDLPFERLKVKIKREIVTFGVAEAQLPATTGTLVEPDAWNALITEPNVVVVDTRNDYEVEVGTFPGARNPHTRAFSEFPEFVERELAGYRQKKVAMFCTGGIRCEKASAYLLSQGFTNVYQLSGGILKYLEVVPPAESLWSGECFVFDGRVALEHGVRQGHHTLCVRCGRPIRVDDGVRGDGQCEACRPICIMPAGL